MIHNLVRIFQIVAVLGCVSSSIYYLLCLWSVRTFLAASKQSGTADLNQHLPPISILKPLKGVDPDIYESFRSHCLQDYPQYEIIFGVSDANDPAVRVVERVRQEFPQRAIQLQVCSEILGPNTKVSNLEQMSRAARYEHLIVSDSDIR